ncbi:MAG: pilus assembly protein TadG-related protein, partial [Actinomycetaceae bacterium]
MSRAAAEPRRRRSTPDDAESGQVMVLGLGFTVVLVVLVLVVAAATAIHLDRKRVLGVADAAAVAAADAVAEEAFYGADREALLTDAAVREAAANYLARIDPSSFDGVRTLELGEPTGAVDGTTAVVTLVATIDPPFVPALVTDAVGPVDVTVTGRARAIDV